MKQSTQSVDKIPVWRQKRDRNLARRVSRKPDSLTGDGKEINDSPPLVVNVFMPSMEKRIQMYEAAGALRQAQMFGLYDEDIEQDEDGSIIGDPYGDDNAFADHLDEIDERGISPYETHPVSVKAQSARNARKAAADASKKKSATPPAGEAEVAPTKQEGASPETPKGS